MIAETITFNDDNRTSVLSQNNTLKNLSKQDVDSTFYISTQNKEHEKGIIYGDRIGKMLGNKALNIYHREDEGFYVGWNIYLWNTKIPLNNSLVSDIKATTDIVFTNPLDNTDKLEVALNLHREPLLQGKTIKPADLDVLGLKTLGALDWPLGIHPQQLPKNQH